VCNYNLAADPTGHTERDRGTRASGHRGALRLQISRARSVAAALGRFGLADVIGIDGNASGIGGIAGGRTFRPRSLHCGHAEQHYCHPTINRTVAIAKRSFFRDATKFSTGVK
jgi:hypothetical protein